MFASAKQASTIGSRVSVQAQAAFHLCEAHGFVATYAGPMRDENSSLQSFELSHTTASGSAQLPITTCGLSGETLYELNSSSQPSGHCQPRFAKLTHEPLTNSILWILRRHPKGAQPRSPNTIRPACPCESWVTGVTTKQHPHV